MAITKPEWDFFGKQNLLSAQAQELNAHVFIEVGKQQQKLRNVFCSPPLMRVRLMWPAPAKKIEFAGVYLYT